jgi:uncharacterized protein
MTDPEIIQSHLCRKVEVDDEHVKVEIYRLEHTDWSLELVDEAGTSVVWDERFKDDEEAFAEAIKTLEEEGLSIFEDNLPIESTTIH